ncbi:MAG: hypothetical protein ACE5JK_01360 [Candidatus Omnitrophota bacterium]
MKKVIAILVVCMLVMGCVTVYAAGKETKSATDRIGDMIQKFWDDLNQLLTKDIPETATEKLSPTGTKEGKGSPKGGRTYK